MKITDEELDLVRQWFDAAQDLNRSYLEPHDYSLARKIYQRLGIRVPSSILENGLNDEEKELVTHD